MTEKEIEMVCDIYCKYKDRACQVVKASEAHPNNKPLKWMREGAEKTLEKMCAECVLKH